MVIEAIGIKLGVVNGADQLERINMVNLNTSIEDWMENKIKISDIVIADDLQQIISMETVLFLTDWKVPIKKKNNRHHDNKTTNQWVRTPMHSGTQTWFSSEGAVELITSTLQ